MEHRAPVGEFLVRGEDHRVAAVFVRPRCSTSELLATAQSIANHYSAARMQAVIQPRLVNSKPLLHIRGRLTLQGPGRNARLKTSLQQDENDNHWDRREQDRGKHDGIIRRVLADVPE